MSRALAALALGAALLVSRVVAQAPAGTPREPTPSPLFQDSRVKNVTLTFTQEEFNALRPVRALPGSGNQSSLQGAPGQRNGLSASRGIEFPYVHVLAAAIDGEVLRDVGARFKGNGTFMLGQRLGKISLKLDFNHFVKGQKLGTIKTLNLHSNITDASYMNEPLAFRSFRAAGVPAPRTAYARVFVQIVGKGTAYYGLFSLVENTDEPYWAARGFAPGGAIFKPVTKNPFQDLGKDWKTYNQTYDPKTTLTPAQEQRLIDFARVVTHGSDAEFATAAGECLDLDNTARFLAVSVWLADLDGILGSGQNYYLYLDPHTNRLSFAAWDQDHSFGQFFTGSQYDREEMDIRRPWQGSNRFLERLFKVDAFRSRYLADLEEFNRTIFQPDRLAAGVDELAALIRPAVKEESAHRLDRFDQAIAGKTPAAEDSSFEGATVPIKPFASARAKSVSRQLAQAR